jgi:hypothetical protein
MLPVAANAERMRTHVAAAFGACSFTLATVVATSAPLGPMQQLARDLGTPKLGYHASNDARTQSTFEFVRSNETVENWTKLYTVVASSVDEGKTQGETRATILRLRGLLAQKHATIRAYDVRDQAPPVAYFDYTLGGEIDVGVIFSPFRGVVTVQQVAAHRKGVISPQDVRHIKALIRYPG